MLNELVVRDEMQVAPAAFQARTALANVEQSRAVAEVQASIILAKANPRDEFHAENRIMNSCKRKSLAECASYSYKRGGQVVTGVSIRLAEVLARHWGNIQYGFREIGRGKDYSEVEAFAHDLETNVKVTRQFQVKHWRDKKTGGQELTEERDKYEMVASMAQRRVRSCLLELIPGDIVEAAEEACKATLMQSIGNIEEQVTKTLAAFAQYKVTQEMIEAYLQRSLKSIVPADIVNLRRIYTSIRDGVASVDEFFKGEAQKVSKLNERFSGEVIDAETGEVTSTQQPETGQPVKHAQEGTQQAVQARNEKNVDSGIRDQENGSKPPESNTATEDTGKAPTLSPEETARVKVFFKEINACTTSTMVDQWRAKHNKRVLNAFGSVESPGYIQVFDCAEIKYRDLFESEQG